jgi:hypothetical protein
VSQQLFQFDVSFRCDGVEDRVGIFWKGVVVFVTPAAGLEARCIELGSEGVVAAIDG